MPYDPTKPANGAPIVSGELRSQFTGLKSLIDSKVDGASLQGAIVANSAGPLLGLVNSLGLTVSDPPTQAEVQAIADKIDELISVLNRT